MANSVISDDERANIKPMPSEAVKELLRRNRIDFAEVEGRVILTRLARVNRVLGR